METQGRTAKEADGATRNGLMRMNYSGELTAQRYSVSAQTLRKVGDAATIGDCETGKGSKKLPQRGGSFQHYSTRRTRLVLVVPVVAITSP